MHFSSFEYDIELNFTIINQKMIEARLFKHINKSVDCCQSYNLFF